MVQTVEQMIHILTVFLWSTVMIQHEKVLIQNYIGTSCSVVLCHSLFAKELINRLLPAIKLCILIILAKVNPEQWQ